MYENITKVCINPTTYISKTQAQYLYQASTSPVLSQNTPILSTPFSFNTPHSPLATSSASTAPNTSTPSLYLGSKFVYTIPGCRIKTATPCSFKSTLILLNRLFTPALLARYAYRPPEELSPMLPTRLDTTAIFGAEDLRMFGRRAWVSRSGPNVFTPTVFWRVGRVAVSSCMECVLFRSGHDAGDMDEEVDWCFLADGLGERSD
jgi:hypothetical protein